MAERAKMQEPRRDTGVTAAEGFTAAAAWSGIRKKELADLAVIASDRLASAAAVFTRNRVQAAPILACRESLAASGGWARAIVVNAGNANACTGEAGLESARRTAREAAELLGAKPSEVLVASTGVIGQQLPVERLLAALPGVTRSLSVAGGADAARAILTTDLRVKESVRRGELGGRPFTVGAMAKGSGMIHPNMATTLAFVTTDAAVSPALLQATLSAATERSFNRLTVDGDTSTNDMIAILANGASGARVEGPAAEAFARALTDVLVDLAKEVARDGEGATKLITVEVTGARTEDDALAVARTVAGSLLVKTAVAGADANWGRIVAAAGRAGVELDPALLAVHLSGVQVLLPGYVSSFSEEEARAVLLLDEVTLGVDLGAGSASARTWTCDLTAGYIAINASYRS